jgi:hypothetical protein
MPARQAARKKGPMDYRIRGRIDRADPDTYIAKVWVLAAGDGEEKIADVADICHPCTLDEVHAACQRFIDRLAHQIHRQGHHVTDVEIRKPQAGEQDRPATD